MIEFLVILLTLILILLNLLIAKNAFGSSKYLFAPPIVAICYYLLRVYPGTVDAAIVNGISSALIGVVFGLLGILFSTLTLMIIPSKGINSHFNLYAVNKNTIYFFIILGVFSVLFTFLMLGRIPFFYMLKDVFGGGNDISMHEARRMNTLEHRDGDTVYFGQGYFRMIYMTIAPIFISSLYVLSRIKKNSALRFSKKIMLLFCFFAALNGQIWPVVNLILLFFIVSFAFEYIFLDKNLTSKEVLKTFSKAFKLMFFIILFIFLYRYIQSLSGREFNNFFLDTFRRIYSDDTVFLYNLFPMQHEYRYGSTWVNDILGFLPGSSQNFSYEVHYLIHGGGWGYTLAPGLFSSGYVNFGFIGIFFLFYISFLVYSIIYKTLIYSNSIEIRVIALFLSLSLAMAISADVASLIYPFFMVAIISIIVIFSNNFLPKSTVGR